MNPLRILACCVPLLSAAFAAEPDADFFMKLLEAEDAKPEKSQVFDFYGRSLGDEMRYKAEGGQSLKAGGETWTWPIKRRIVKGGYLVESTVLPQLEQKWQKPYPFPVTVTWYDNDSFPRVSWRRVIVSERDGKPVVLDRWKGVMWFSESESKIQWTRHAAFKEPVGEPSSDGKSARTREVGEFIGTATEHFDADGFQTLFTIQPEGDGLEVWKETRWKK